jgi:SAM-dependent methyltransferase
MSRVHLPESDLWDSHWKDYDRANTRNPAQSYRQELMLRLLNDGTAASRRLLDIGSGNGAFLEAAARRWPEAELRGLELSESAVAYARRRLPSATFRVCDLLDPAALGADEAGWATHAVCSEVLEHLDSPIALLEHARAWLAPGCVVVVTVPGGPMSAFDRHIGHRRHYSPADVSDVIAAAGLELVDAGCAGFPFFNLYRVLVIARGERLIADAKAEQQGKIAGYTANVMTAAFSWLFRLNFQSSPLGWQIFAVAREPRGDSAMPNL